MGKACREFVLGDGSSSASWDSFISQLILDHEHQFLFYFIDIMARNFSH
jgi:hypothetical protein